MTEVIALVSRVVEREVLSTGQSILCGELAEISLSTILHLMDLESLTGWLLIDGDARIDFHAGHVTTASKGALRGACALREILVCGGSAFEVFRGEPRSEVVMCRISLTILDAFRLRDEWQKMETSVLRLVGDQRWHPTGGGVDALMEQLDGKRTLAELVRHTGLSLGTVVEEILEAKTLGLVEVCEHCDEPVRRKKTPSISAIHYGADSAAVDFFELLDRARVSIRQRSLESAEELLNRALHLRPNDRIAQQNLRRVRELQTSA